MELPKEFTLQEIAVLAGGAVGAGAETKVKRVAFSPLQSRDGDLALFFEPKLIERLNDCRASAVVIPEGVDCRLPHIKVKRPQLALQRMLSAIQPRRFLPDPGVHSSAVVDATAVLGAEVAVGPLA